MRDNLGYALGPQPATLAAFLKAHGYATGGAVSSIVLSHATGVVARVRLLGGQHRADPARASRSRGCSAAAATREALLADWVSGKAAGPFFAFLHLFEPHSPYEPPEPYRSRYPLLYDGEIARADEIVGEFVRFLKERDLYDRALVVFLSDHGEGLNDHGEDEHGVLLYREEIHVPLMVKFPAAARRGETVPSAGGARRRLPDGRRRPRPRSARRGSRAGRSRRSCAGPAPAASERRIYSETLYPRLHLGWSDLASLVDARDHYIESPHPELYDVVADPGEKNDLAPGLPPAFRSMRAELVADAAADAGRRAAPTPSRSRSSRPSATSARPTPTSARRTCRPRATGSERSPS